MANMSYCQFENTQSDFQDCMEWLSMNEPSKLSPDEMRAFKRLVKQAARLAEDYGEEFADLIVDVTPA